MIHIFIHKIDGFLPVLVATGMFVLVVVVVTVTVVVAPEPIAIKLLISAVMIHVNQGNRYILVVVVGATSPNDSVQRA
jgi:hypothetical protein